MTANRVDYGSSRKNPAAMSTEERGRLYSADFNSWNRASSFFARELNALPVPMQYANFVKGNVIFQSPLLIALNAARKEMVI